MVVERRDVISRSTAVVFVQQQGGGGAQTNELIKHLTVTPNRTRNLEP